MSANQLTTPLQAIVLCWLLCHEDGGTPCKLATALYRVKGSDSEEAKHIKAALTSLEEAGLVHSQKKRSYVLTSRGTEVGLGLLRWKKLEKGADFRVVKRQLERCRLEETVLDLPEKDGDKTARTLAKAYQLMVSATPKLTHVVEALAWYALGIRTAEAFTVPAAIEVLLSRLAGSETRLSVPKAIEALIDKGTPATPPLPPPLRPPHGAPLPDDESAFAARVQAAARASKTGRFGRDKVFISHVAQQLVREGVAIGDVDVFKSRLVSAHRADLLSLHRADLVEAMNAADVEESEARYRTATFHFLKIA